MSAPRMTQKDYEAYLARIRGKSAPSSRPRISDGKSTVPCADASNARSCASAMTRDDYRRALDAKNGTKIPVGDEWSGSERRYYYGVLGCRGDYEGETIRITPADMEDHVYTPDFVTVQPDGVKVYHEVKGNYSFKNQGEARLRFCFASHVRPDAVFVWAKESASRNRWTVDVWFNGGRRRVKARSVVGFEIKGTEVAWKR